MVSAMLHLPCFGNCFRCTCFFFYTDVFGLPAAAVGTMFLITRIWDSAFDPIVGVMADRTQSKYGKFRPYLLWMGVPFGVAGILTFTTPDFGPSGKMLYAYITYSFMMMIYSLINVPYASLLGVMSNDPKERTTLATFRMSFAFGGSVLVLALAEPLVSTFSSLGSVAPNAQQGWQLSAIVFAIIASVLFYLTFKWTKERVVPVGGKNNSFKADIKDLMKNAPWFILLGAGIAALVFNSIRDGATIYYFKYYIQSQDAFDFGPKSWALTFTYSTLYLVLGQAANIVGVIMAKPLSDKLGKRRTFLTAMFMAGVLSLLFFWLDRDSIWAIFLLQFVISMCAGIIFPLLWAMYADIADYSEWKTGRRATGLIFSSSSMAQKFGWTIGGALTGWLLGAYGFKANIEQTEAAQTGIRMMMSIFPAVGALFSVLFIYLYQLSDPFMEKIGSELQQKRSEQN
jgi:glycoside/pentoside/hexuronide:cation symporter, GPH family